MSAELLRELARAKVTFQLRAIEAIIKAPASGMETRSATDAQRRGPKGDSPTRAAGDAQP